MTAPPVVRPAVGDDAAAVIAVRQAAWRAAYGPYLPAHVWDEYDAPAATARLHDSIVRRSLDVLVAAPAGTVVGYTFSGAARDDDLPSGTGEVYAIYVDPAHWSSGVGHALLTATLARLGERAVVLWVLEANARARRFYDRAGFRPDGAVKAAQLPGGVELPELRYRTG